MKKSPIYITVSININNLVPLFYILSLIYIKNLFNFNFNFILLNHLIIKFNLPSNLVPLMGLYKQIFIKKNLFIYKEKAYF